MDKNEICEICGTEMKVKLSFHGKKKHSQKREVWICPYCGYSTIKETYHEQMVREGKDDTIDNR